ncbi:hypothetical protein [Phormidium sp. CCY1219]|uniref:hypothetical protein n=1 Tax=Phormidium sp. CCY1219 TaxID=2886104 RepID=UPI002D1F5522|nr:hypothetical protein [Phormidium sp. CCY1219]MEB3829687.1 hypothetical protein [Phormidium sp. CCY1219]
MSISLIDVAKYYQELPHQKQALEILEDQIQATHPTWLTDESEFVETWRNEEETAEVFPQADIISDGKQLRGEWQGQTYIIDANELSVLVLDTLDPETGETTDREFRGDRFVDLSINPSTGHIAVGVFLDYFVATTVSAVFIIEPQPGGYNSYVAQLPGSRPLPNEFSTYPLASIGYVRFVFDNLQVSHSDAAANVALVVFKPSTTPAMQYAGCVDLNAIEGTGGLCSNRS